MLPKKYRLRLDRDVRRTYRSRHAVRGAYFLLRIHGRNDAAPTRFAFVVSKRISKKATERNTVARQARGCIGRVLPSVVHGSDVLVIAEKPFSTYDRHAACDDLLNLLRRTRLLSS